jgi:hypothetical protein
MTMKRVHCLLAFLLLILAVTGCDWHGIRGNGHVTTERRSLGNFSRLDAGGYYKVEWHPGPVSFSLTTDENLFSHIRTSVQGDVLKLEMKGPLSPTRGVKVEITSPSLTGARLSGALQMSATSLSGGTFALETSGATKVALSGQVNRLLASLTGASKLQADDLITQDVEISVTGAGKADVYASNLLRAAITGAGNVSYHGNPKSVEKKIAGAGKIEAR